MKKQSGFIGVLLVIVIFFAAILILLFVWKNNSGTNSAAFNSVSSTPSSAAPVNNPLLDFGSGNSVSNPTSSGGNTSAKNSPYAGMLSLSSGSAESTYQPTDEYVEIYNNSQSSVDITGWSLENAFGNRPLQTTGNQAVTDVVPERITIPQGTNFLDPSGSFALGPIILKPGDTAIVTTGGPFPAYPFKITASFRANKCAGYLNYTYPFDPELDNSCPAPANEPGINGITDVCYNYVRYLPLCYDPAVQNATNLRNNFQQNCINYIDTHFNYAACVAVHGDDANFNSPTWRVFLGLNHELWHEPDDSIKLLDGNGKLVDEIDY